MHIGIIDEGRLSEIPKRHWAAHEFCFHIHDLIANLTRAVEESGASNVSITLRDEADVEAFRNAEHPFEFLATTGRTDEERRILVNHVCRALLPDMLHFLFGALTALEKRKFTLALSLFRKPFKEGLPLLALMCADERQFFQKIKDDPRGFFDGQAFNSQAKKDVIAAAIQKCDGASFITADALYLMLFDYSNDRGFAGLFDKTTHLFTKRKGNETENYNINFIFKDPRDNDIYDSCYGMIAYILLAIHIFQIELASRMKFAKASYLEHLLRTSVGAYEAIFGKRRSKMIPFFNRQFREFMKCPVCDAQIRLRRSTAPRFFIAEMLMCLRCGHDHHFPLTWLFSRASDDSEASSLDSREDRQDPEPQPISSGP